MKKWSHKVQPITVAPATGKLAPAPTGSIGNMDTPIDPLAPNGERLVNHDGHGLNG